MIVGGWTPLGKTAAIAGITGEMGTFLAFRLLAETRALTQRCWPLCNGQKHDFPVLSFARKNRSDIGVCL